MKWLRDLSMRSKILGSMTLVIVMVVGFQLIYFVSQQIGQLTDGLEQKAVSMSRLVAYQIRAAFDLTQSGLDSSSDIQATFEGAAQDADFRWAAVYADDGTMVVGQGLGLRKSSVPPRMTENVVTEIEGGEIVVTAPVRKGATKGTLMLGFSTDSIAAKRTAFVGTTFGIGLASLAAAFFIAFMVGSSLGRRLQELANVAEKVARGDLSHPPIADVARDEVGRMSTAFNVMLGGFRTLAAHVTRVADGDLSNSTDTQGDLAEAFNRMVVNQRALVKQIAETAIQLNSAAEEFVANARQQELGATEQSSSVEETRRTMESLLSSAREIGKTSQSVLQNAEKTQTNSQVVAERIAALSAHTQRITEILEVIKDIANKSDLLALNAALEGTKAGEAGRGFSLVATQMQRLAENVMGSVRDIKELTATINEATQSSVLATEESTKLASDTTRSARQIALIIQQQQSGTEQVTRAMNDVSQIVAQTTEGGKQIVASVNDLVKLSERLQELVGRFQLGGASKATEIRVVHADVAR